MFDSAYKFHCVGFTRSANAEFILGIKHYSFSTDKLRYLVEVECYISHIYIIQYYPAKFKSHPKKYMILTNEFKCMTIVGTCIHIMLDMLQSDEKATFGFIGSNTYNPLTKTEDSIDQTQRWRVYKYAMEAQMGTRTFTHAMIPAKSRYVMINKIQN